MTTSERLNRAWEIADHLVGGSDVAVSVYVGHGTITVAVYTQQSTVSSLDAVIRRATSYGTPDVLVGATSTTLVWTVDEGQVRVEAYSDALSPYVEVPQPVEQPAPRFRLPEVVA